MRYGIVIKWDAKKKFGFIRPDRGPDIFFHVSALGGCREPRIEPGQAVKYEVDPATLPKRVKRSEPNREDPTPSQPAANAIMVELIDKIPGAILDQVSDEARVAHHPKARRKKPTWRKWPEAARITARLGTLENEGKKQKAADTDQPPTLF